MEPIQPSKPSGVPAIPLTEELLRQQKKLLESGKMEPAYHPKDIAQLTPQAEKELHTTKYDAFLESVKEQLANLNPEAADYLPKAVSRLISTALRQEFGEKILSNPGYPQMESVLIRKILHNPEHTAVIQDFLGLLSQVEESEPENKEL